MQFLYYYHGPKFTFDQKVKYFSETRQSYGRTALMLSGGASFGKYHQGLILALNEQDLLPQIIVGSSAGSLIGAILCTLQRSEITTFSTFEYCYS